VRGVLRFGSLPAFFAFRGRLFGGGAGVAAARGTGLRGGLDPGVDHVFFCCFRVAVVISVHGKDENTPPNLRIVSILCWINFGAIAHIQSHSSRTRFRFRGGGQGAALTPHPTSSP
jgi:hypothetical protein